MFGFLKSKQMNVYTPVNGNVVSIEKVKDPVFSQKMMGEGFAVKPLDGKISAPVNGIVQTVFSTLHALTIKDDNGTDILIHIGLDTVELNGEGFSLAIQAGQSVKVGDLLVNVDLSLLAEKGKDDIVIVVFPEMEGKKVIPQCGKKQLGEIAAVLK